LEMDMLRGERDEAEINHNSSILGTHIFSLELTKYFIKITLSRCRLNWQERTDTVFPWCLPAFE
jgi:hypothetical protein